MLVLRNAKASVLLNEHNAEGGLALSAAPADLARAEALGSYLARSVPGLDQDSQSASVAAQRERSEDWNK